MCTVMHVYIACMNGYFLVVHDSFPSCYSTKHSPLPFQCVHSDHHLLESVGQDSKPLSKRGDCRLHSHFPITKENMDNVYSYSIVDFYYWR